MAPERFPRSIAVIPARGGSQRLPGKNTRRFFGHPLVAYSISAAQRCGLFDEVVVSTDDDRCGQIAEWYGARYIPRPAALATAEAGLVEVAEHALGVLAESGCQPELLCQLMPNCPLRRSADIIAHGRLFVEQDRRFQISVVPYRSVYPHWAMIADDRGQGAWYFDRERESSHAMGHVRCPTGAIWWVRVADFLVQREFYGPPWHMAEMDPDRGIDIDRGEELDQAEVVVHGLRGRDGRCPLEPIERAPWPGDTP